MSDSEARPRVSCRWHHLHLTAPSPAEAASWYADAFGLRAVSPGGGLEAAVSPDRGTLVWYPAEVADGSADTWAETRSSVGTTVDHFGWSVADLDARTAALEEAGATVVGEPRTIGPSSTGEHLRISFLVDPFGAKLELLEDHELRGLHHVHLLTPEVETHRDRWLELFGGTAETFKGFVPGIRHDGFWFLFRESPDALDPTRGRAIDHLGLAVDSVDDALAALAGEVPDEGPAVDFGPLRVGFVELPGGVRVELVEG